MVDEANDFLMGGGKKSASFPTPGTTVAGHIVKVGKPIQQRDPATKLAKTWPNGDPMMQLPVEIQTGELTVGDPEDDGVRVLYLAFRSRDAVRDAVRAANADGLREGGHLAVTFTHQDAPERPGLSGVKNYTAVYKPPADAFLSAPDPGAGFTPPTPAPSPTAGVAPESTNKVDPVETAKQLIKLGQSDAIVVASTGLDASVVAAVRNAVSAGVA